MTKTYFSASETTFYRDDIHGEPGTENSKMPSDVTEVTQEVFDTMVEGRSKGFRVVADEGGLPKLVDKLPPTDDELASAERAWRDKEIKLTDWLVSRHRDESDMHVATTVDQSAFAGLMSYRQLLRQWPESASFPATSGRPVQPTWVADA